MRAWNSFFASLLLLVVVPLATADAFNIFENLFNQAPSGGGGGGGHHRSQNAGSDSAWYRQNYEGAPCDRYLCPGTLSCVHFPHHCPCAFPAVEDKVEFGEGSMACVSKGGWKAGEAQRKIELARKGLL